MTCGNPFFDEDFVRRFVKRRLEEDSVNSCIDEPAILERVRRRSPCRVVELGCGAGALTSSLADICGEIAAVDQSPAMVNLAVSEVVKPNVRFFCSPFEDFNPGQNQEMVVSGMAMHLVEDLGSVCRLVYKWLQPGGSFVFTQRHPIRTANPTGDDAAQFKPSWTVSSYFEVGQRRYSWLGYDVPYIHRTLADIVSAVIGAGFVLLEVDEPRPQHHLDTERANENRSSPSVLLVHCAKPQN